MKVTCQQTGDGLRLNIGAHEGSYAAWWKDLRIEIYGWKPRSGEVAVNGNRRAERIDGSGGMISFIVPDDGKGAVVDLR